MPLIVRWYLRTALVMFMLALIAGILHALSGVFPFLPPGLTPVYFHLLMVGWVTQFILGVALWMLPKYSLAKPRGIEAFSWVAYVLLNTGLLIRAVAEPMNALRPETPWGWLLVVSAVFQLLGGLFFVTNAWQRVKGK